MHLSSLSLSKGLLLISLLFLTACTDYVQQMDDGFDEWEQAQKQKTLSSSSKTEMSCSSEELSSSSFSVILSSDSHEKSSSSTEKKNSSSSNNKVSSSSTKTSSSSKVSSSNSTTKISSSSAKANSSSSSKKIEVSSSSKKMEFSSSGKASWTYLNPAISYGEMLDDRDGQVYKTVKIGEQTWMAENLNYEVANSYCYNDSTKYCDKYGHLYTWTVAMDNAMGPVRKCTDGVCQSNFSGNIQGICPTGWRLPFIEDFDTLFLAIGGITVAGTKLKSTSGWIDDGNGINVYGFSAIPAGEKSASGYETKGYMAYFWSATNSGNFPGAYGLYFAWDDDGKAYQNVSFHYYAQSVRCIKDVSNILPIYSSSENNIESSSSASLALPCKTSKEDN